MASNIKFKRSAVQNRVPTTAQLELGELALNTYDGKLYTEKNSGSAAVVEIGSILSSLVVDGDNGGGNGDVTFHGATASRDLLWDASADSLIAKDNAKIVVGDGTDLSIYSDGTNGLILSDALRLKNKSGGDVYLKADSGAAVELYHNDLKRFETTADGADISGTGSLKLPVGTTAQRSGSPTAGDMRYNSTTGSFEGYTNGWGELGGAGIGIGSTSVNPGSGVVSPLIGVGYTTINFVGAGLSVTGYGTTIVVDLGSAVSRKYGRKIHSYTATANQTAFTGLSYTDGASQVSVYLNGAKLSAATYTATSGSTVVLGTGASVGDEIEIICIDSGVDLSRTVNSYTATANQTTFTGLGYSDGGDLDVYLNGIRLAQSDYTANNGTSLVLAAGASVGDLLEVVDMGQGAQWSSGFGADADDIYRLNGGVGIGTTNPTDKLNIVGNAEIVGIVTATSFTGTLNTAAQTNITSLGTLTALGVAGDVTITDTDTGSSAGPEFKLYRNSASPADADYLGQIKFAGESDTSVERNYAKITGKILDASNGTEDGALEFSHIKAGSQVITGRWRSDSLQLLNGTNLTVAGTAEITGDVTVNGDELFIADSIKHIGDTDTSISFPSNDTIRFTTGGSARVTVTDATTTVANNLTVTGNLQVDGTNTVVNSTTMTVDDKNIVLGSGAANDAAADGGGITLESGNGNKTFNWVDSTDAWTSSEHIHLGDNKKLLLGTHSDSELYFTGTNTILDHTSGSGTLFLRGDALRLQTTQSTPEDYIVCNAGGAVELYHNDGKRFETISDGVKFSGGRLYAEDNQHIVLGAGNDLQLYHNATRSYIQDNVSNDLRICSNDIRFRNGADGATSLYVSSSGVTQIYHNGNVKLDTTSTGVNVTGLLSATTLSCDDNADTSMSSSSDGQLKVGGNGYTGAIALDGSNMNIYHNSASRGLVLGTNETARLTISSGGNVDIATGALTISNDIKSSDDNFYVYSYNGGSDGQVRSGIQFDSSNQRLEFYTATNERLQIDSDGNLHVKGTNHEVRFYRDAGDRYGAITYTGSNLDIKNPSNDHTRVINAGGTEIASFNHDTTIDFPGGVLQLGTANTSSAHLNAYENMTFNIDTDNDDTNRTFTWKTDNSTELMKLDESGILHTVQDYPNYRPTLDLNFATIKKLDPRITYERTGSASYTDEFGKVVLVGDNVPRFDHDPVTRECKGLLIETTRTNLMKSVIRPNLPKSTYNSNSNGSIVEVSDDVLAPDGSAYTLKLYWTNYTANQNGYRRVGNTSTETGTLSAGTYGYSFFVKRGTDGKHNMEDFLAGTQSGIGASQYHFTTQDFSPSYSVSIALCNNSNVKIEKYPHGWYRLSGTLTTTQSFTPDNTGVSYYVLGNSTFETFFEAMPFYHWGFQLEVGDHPSSYIGGNVSATTTRGYDFVRIDGTEFTDFYNQSEGTLLSEFIWNGNSTTSGAIANINALSTSSYADSIMFMEMGTANGYFGRVYKSSNGRQLSNGSSVTADIFGGAGPDRVSFAWSDTVVNEGLAAYWNGSLVATEANEDRTPTNMTELRIGQGWQSPTGDGSGLSAHIKTLSYYPKRLPNSQLATLTS